MSSVKWQDLLDLLTLKGIDKEVHHYLARHPLKNDEVFKICFKKNKCYMEEWLEGKFKTQEKSASESVKCRLEGNQLYQKGKDEEALKLYNASVRAAPYRTIEFALGLGNRSAVLMRLNYFEEAIRDIDLALQTGNTDIPTQKLLKRKALLLHKLKLSEECLDVIKTLYPNKDEINDAELKNLYHDLSSKKYKSVASARETGLPLPAGGESEFFPSASAKVRLRLDYKRGRYVQAIEDLEIGDVVFVEKPFALVVLPDQYDRHCHHCCKKSVAFIPCAECRQAQFCSEVCRVTAWDAYHRWECGGLEICHCVGIAHLGLRVALLADDSNRYKKVCDLVTHIPDMKIEDLYMYANTAVLLTLYLEKFTSFFEDRPDISVDLMGTRILQHVAQLITNGHAITKIDSSGNGGGITETETQARIATAIYPSASMMNHSCDHNISNSFVNEVLVVRTSKYIRKEEEVLNCYGPHYTSMGREERQRVLKEQYFFTCECDKCASQFASLFSAFQCSFCSGPVMEGDGECSDCGRPQMLVELANMALIAQKGYHEGDSLLDKNETLKGFEILEKCVALASKCLYKHNSDLREYKNSLARALFELGRLKECVPVIEDCLDSITNQFGPYSVQLFRELYKLKSVLDLIKTEEYKTKSPEYSKWNEKYRHYMQEVLKIATHNAELEGYSDSD